MTDDELLAERKVTGRLPPELYLLIIEHLPTDDLLTIRFANKLLKALSSGAFIRHFFDARYHLFSDDGLKTAMMISRNSEYSPLIQQLHISTHHLLSAQNPDVELESRPPWDTSRVIKKIGLKNYLDKERKFRDSKEDKFCLTLILKEASKCHTIVLGEGETPWGAGTTEKETRYAFQTSTEQGEDTEFIRRVIRVIIASLNASKTQIKKLEFKWPSSITTDELRLDKNTPWVFSLNQLRLQVNQVYIEPYEDPYSWIKLLGKFISRFSSLETLDLDFTPSLDEEQFAKLNRVMTLPGLRTLSLGNADCKLEDLLKFLRDQQATLNELSLDSIAIFTPIGESLQTVLAIIRDDFSLTSFRMAYCFMNEDEISFTDGSLESNDIWVNGSDPSLFERLISGIRTDKEMSVNGLTGCYVIS